MLLFSVVLDSITSAGKVELSGPKNHSKFTSTIGGGSGTNSVEQVIVIVSPRFPVVDSLMLNGPTATAVLKMVHYYTSQHNYIVLVFNAGCYCI